MLALDGIVLCSLHGGEAQRDNSCALRVTAFVQGLLGVLFVVMTQVCRALMHFASFNPSRMKEGVRDLVSVIVQVVALPVLGVVTTISPDTGLSWANTLIEKFHSEQNLSQVSPLSDRTSKVVGGILALPVALVQSVVYFILNLFSMNGERIKSEGACILKSLRKAAPHTFTLGIYSILAKEGAEELGEIYRTTLPQPRSKVSPRLDSSLIDG